MRTTRQPLTVLFAGALCLVASLPGCDGQDFGFDLGIGGSQLTSTTVLTSTSLRDAGAAAQDSPETLAEIGLGVTPDNVTGQVLSLLFATDGQDDEGIVVFGQERPDIAPADSDLIDFDFEAPEPITASVSLQPGFVGGQSSMMVMLFGYMDMHMTIGGDAYVVRIALADVDGMVRGDKLLQDATTGTFRWYDLDAASFTATRPTNPAAIEAVRDFVDPIRPELVFYPINAALIEPIGLDPTDLAAAIAMDVDIDFVMTDAVVLVGETDPSAVDDETVITTLDLTQNAFDPFDAGGPGFGPSGFVVGATMELTLPVAAPAP